MLRLRGEEQLVAHDTSLLVDTLNELMAKLNMHLPLVLETPSDLTPALLLGILESILESRLPIPPSVRASRDFPNKVQAMKIFLGVFESDILGGQDVGLSDIDPRRLAAGEEEEVEFIGELLCWLGRRKGILAGPSREDGLPPTLPLRARRRPVSPSTHSTVTSGAHSNLSMMPTAFADSDTTVTSVGSGSLIPLAHADLPELPSFPPAHGLRRSLRRSQPPRCIHELDEPSFMLGDDFAASLEPSMCHCGPADEEDDLPPTPKTPLPIRYNGSIGVADESAELRVFYERRSPPSGPSTATQRAKSYAGLSASLSQPPTMRTPEQEAQRIITRHNSPTAYTLALMKERARLLEELAKIKGSPVAE